MWIERSRLFRQFQQIIEQGFPLVCLYGLPGVGKRTFCRQLELKFLPGTCASVNSASELLALDEINIGLISGPYQPPSETQLQELHSRSRTLVFTAERRPPAISQPWMEPMQIPCLDASQVFGLARKYLPDLKQLTQQHRWELLSICAGHPGLVSLYLLQFRENLGTDFKIPLDLIRKERTEVCTRALDGISPRSYEGLLKLSYWELPAGMGEGLKRLLRDKGEEIFHELKDRALLERSFQDTWRVNPLVKQFLGSSEDLRERQLREELYEVSSGFTESAIAQERLAQGIILNHDLESESKNLFCSHEGAQNPSRILRAMESREEGLGPWMSRLKGRLIFETGELEEALSYLEVENTGDQEDENWISLYQAKALLLKGDSGRAREILQQILSSCQSKELLSTVQATLASCCFSLGESDFAMQCLEENHDICLQYGFDDLRALLLVNLNVTSIPDSERREETQAQILSLNPDLYSANKTKLFYRKTEILIMKGHFQEAFDQVESLLVQASNRQEHQKLAHAFLYGGMIFYFLHRHKEALWSWQRAEEFFSFVGDHGRARICAKLALFSIILMGRLDLARESLDSIEKSYGDSRDEYMHILLECLSGRLPKWSENSSLHSWQISLREILEPLSPPLAWPCDYYGEADKEDLLQKIQSTFAKKLSESLVFVRFSHEGPRLVCSNLIHTSDKEKNQYELVLNLVTEEFWERTRGELKLARKRNLLALFITFLKSPGEYLTSSELYRGLWQKPYDSEVDEPVVRMAINRLKKEIEPTATENQYIARHLMEPSYCLLPSRKCLVICTLKDYYELLERDWRAESLALSK
jgi:tetratricopeptide (TPR) repeat protein